MIEYIFDTQMLIFGKGLPEDEIREYINANIPGDCLLVIGSDEMVRVHFHTNSPWKVMEYLSHFGTLHDVIVENMQDQSESFDPQNGSKPGSQL